MLKLKNIKKTYVSGDEKVEALKGISIEFRESEFVSILGQSGCGKTTLLNIIGGLDRYTSGDLIINGKSTKEFKDRDWGGKWDWLDIVATLIGGAIGQLIQVLILILII